MAEPSRDLVQPVIAQDASWRQLATAEREALSRLSVFRGGFTPASAREVAAAALPVLGALADKSLLRKDADGKRLSLHPLVQQLAAARLAEAGQADASRRTHAALEKHLARTAR